MLLSGARINFTPSQLEKRDITTLNGVISIVRRSYARMCLLGAGSGLFSTGRRKIKRTMNVVYSYGKAKYKMDESQYIPWAKTKCSQLKEEKWREVLKELEMGYFIGSGAIESSNKIVVQRRFKQAGMR